MISFCLGERKKRSRLRQVLITALKFYQSVLFACAVSICIILGTTCGASAASVGSLTTYTCCPQPTSSTFVNASGQLCIRVSVPSSESCHGGAGCDWDGLSNAPFQNLTFDVQASSSVAGGSSFYVILEGSNESGTALAFFSLNDISTTVDLGNGWTRYTIGNGAVSPANQSQAPSNIDRILFQEYPSLSGTTASIVFGNFVLNGNTYPVHFMTPTACPPLTGDPNSP